MSDELDATADRIEFDTKIAVKNVSDLAGKISRGEDGDCGLCGEHFSRVIEVEYKDATILACGRCRDRHGIS